MYFFLLRKLIFLFDVGLNGIRSLKEADISLMYRLLRLPNIVKKPQQGWGRPPSRNNIKTADDIERIHRSRNYICHKDASEIETTEFNNLVLDLMGVIHF